MPGLSRRELLATASGIGCGKPPGDPSHRATVRSPGRAHAGVGPAAPSDIRDPGRGHFPCATGRLRRRLVMPDCPPTLAPRNIRIDQVLESMTQYYRLLVKQGIAGIAAARGNQGV